MMDRTACYVKKCAALHAGELVPWCVTWCAKQGSMCVMTEAVTAHPRGPLLALRCYGL